MSKVNKTLFVKIKKLKYYFLFYKRVKQLFVILKAVISDKITNYNELLRNKIAELKRVHALTKSAFKCGAFACVVKF